MVPAKYWLLKAEPDSRIVKGKDVKFSVDDFESVKTSPWEGVRNYEARNLMKEMQVGDKALFYHSNCKSPGIAAFAEVSKEAYPDHTAWDASHPYFDAKTKKDDPRWFMVDLTFVSRATHFVPLSLLRFLSDGDTLPPEISYIEEDGLKALKGMDLVGRGRLSVQRVEESAWNAIVALSQTGGWEEMDLKVKRKRATKTESKAKAPQKPRKAKAPKDLDSEDQGDKDEDSADEKPHTKRVSKRKAKEDVDEDYSASRRPRKAKR